MNIAIPPYVMNALELLSASGFEAYIVGGCVRDAFLGKTPYDWDITTSAKPKEILKVFASFKTVETGIKHGTVTVISDGSSLEITTMRVDGEYTDNRHPDSVEFTDNITLDLSRRDFTVNAMAYSPKSGLCDPFGGRDDLKNRVIKCVGNPYRRFSEDALRILRGLRFSSVLGFSVEEKTAQAIKEQKALLKNVAAERKRAELLKLLCGSDVRRILTDFPQVIFEIIPELAPMYGFPQNTPYHIYDVWEHTAASVESVPPVPEYRMAMLLHDAGKPQAFYTDSDGTAHFKGHQNISCNIAMQVLSELRFSRVETEFISRLVRYHDTRPTGEKTDTLITASELGADFMKKLYPVLIADAKAQNPENLGETLARLQRSKKYLDEAVEKGDCLSVKQLALNGRDVLAAGFEGEKIGEILSWLVKQVISEKVENKKENLTEYIKTHRAI